MLGRTNTGGGGSGGLNFQVIGGTTAPSNPKENMIWVNTSTKITSYIFSATQPTGSAGMVWISTGTSSTIAFNALKKNGLQVYPISAKQYVNGAWVSVTALSYQGGEWVEWISFLYDRGEIGLGGIPTQIYKDGSKTDVVVTLNADYISINLLGNKVNRAGFPDAVDFSAYSTIKATVKAPSKWNNAVQFRFGVDSANHTSAAYKAQALNGYTAGTEYTITLDISAYNKASKPWFELYNGTGQGEEKSLYVLKIDLE